MTAAIDTRALTKMYGRSRGIEGLDLQVEPGEVFGFLGPNGAGKTTTIRVLLDLIRATSGSAQVLGLDVHRDRVALHRRIGYVPGDLVLYPKMTGRALVDWFADLRGRPGSPAVVDDLVDRFAIELHRPVAELSKGNRQKIGLLQAFAHEPDLVILDEPTTGLDPLMQDQFQRLVRETCAAGRTVFLSSHSLDEVQHVADRVGIIRDGRLIAVEVVEALRERALRRVEIHGAVRLDPAAFTAIPGVRDPQVSADGTHLTFTAAGHLDAVVKAAAAFEVVDFVSQPADLDEIFLTYYRGGADPADANLRGGSADANLRGGS